jgi:hypothetical protein
MAVAALALGSSSAIAQVKGGDSIKQSAPARQSVPEAKQLDSQVTRIRGETGLNVPAAAQFNFGPRAVAAGSTLDGPVALARGNLDVFGTIRGDAIVLGGDIRVHHGGRITGDAYAAGGQIVIDGGVIEGSKRSLRSAPAAATTDAAEVPPGRRLTTWESVKLTVGWFAILTIIGLGVMIFAAGSLDGVVIALERGFARSFWIGVAGQLVMLPGLLLLIVALAITVLGALLIPFAIVSYVIAAAGLVTLGFLAVARLTGSALTPDQGTASPRGVHIRALFLGLIVYFGLWLVAAVFAWNPLIGVVLRAVAIAVTWMAATVGLGAALSSRAGTQRPGVPTSASKRAAQEDLSWQTPTPVTGVAAARRPATPSARGT